MPPPPRPLQVHCRRIDLPAPLDALARLASRPRPFLRLAAGEGTRGVAWSFLATDPLEDLEVGTWPGTTPLVEVLQPACPAPRAPTDLPMPFAGGWAGFLGYEARSGVEDCPPARPSPMGFPALWLGRYPAVLGWNHRTGEGWVAGEGADPGRARAAAERLLGRLHAGRPAPALPLHGGPVRLLTSRDTYLRKVEAARSAIRDGEIFQTNVSHRLEASFEGRPVDLFARFAALQAAPYMTYLDLGGGRAILSGSPERFLRVRGRRAETDPMKGTRPRGESPAEDRRLRRELETSEKERAELAMIVDLSRNDLSRVCRPGTVRVRVARRLLPFVRVHQAIGVVTGQLEDGLDRIDLLQASFPPGSVTGAPKVRAMEILDDLEREGRGPYCGAIGWLDTAGDMDLAVGIRTILVADGKASWRVGGGITLRSDALAEWEETLAKGRTLALALGTGGTPS